MIRTEHTPQPNGIAARAIAARDGTMPMIATLGTEWARQVNEAWQSTVNGILEAGRLLILAKDDLDHGEWETMIEHQLLFTSSTAQRLMKIARDERLANPAHRAAFPPSWTTLYELTKLSDDAFEAKLADGTIHPGMQRSVAIKATKAPKDMEIVEQQQEAPKTNNLGPRINIPEGMTAEAVVRKGMALEAEGAPSADVARQIGIGTDSYRTMRDIVLLADHKGLSERDTQTAARALSLLNETQRLNVSWPLVETIAAKVWGSGADSAPRAVREAKRIERFEHSFGIIMQGCLTADELDLPYLTAERAKKAVKEINAARRSLSDLLNRIKGVHE